MMSQKLNLISINSRRDPKMRFTSLCHLINKENLVECYGQLKRNKACGVDGVSVEEYGESLSENLDSLLQKLKSKSWRPLPVRRSYIPKPGKQEKRGLGIPDVESKLVQVAIKNILEAIFEPCFSDTSFGFRPNRNCHQAIRLLNDEVMKKQTNYIVEVDIRKFFDRVEHYWLLRCIEERIGDPNFIWIIRKLLQAGVMEDGIYYDSVMGTPQGGIASPILSNIYLHYVLDLWFEVKFRPQTKGRSSQIRYCDDFIACFENRKEAEEYLSQLKDRLSKFGLEVAEDKTKLIEFGRQAWQRGRKYGKKVETFTFLGFTHYCASSRKGNFKVVHKTSKVSFNKGLKKITEFVKKARSVMPLKDIWRSLNARLVGHYNYFAISGNYASIQKYFAMVLRITFKWINRRSQKKSMNWEKFNNYLRLFPLKKPRIYHAFYMY